MANTGTGCHATLISFSPGTTAKSADVNANFTALNNASGIDAATMNGHQYTVGTTAPVAGQQVHDLFFKTAT